jgi:dolichol-phosphate mannosyltransferase
MDAPKCTVILPTYKEAGNIQRMAKRLRELYPDFHILIMDDNSDDGSKELIEELNDPMTSFIERNPEDRGLSASILQGISDCETDFFINMDCDFQHPPEAVAYAYERLKNGADLCIGIREERTALSPMRWIASWGAHTMAMTTLWLRDKKGSKDIMSGFFGGRTELYQQVIREHRDEMDMRGFKALFDLLKFGPSDVNIEEITFKFGKREAGESKIDKNVMMSILRQCEPLGNPLANIAERIMVNRKRTQ